MPWRISQQVPSQLIRIFVALGGEFINEALEEKAVLRRAHRTPEAHGNSRFRQLIIDQDVGNCVRHGVTNFHAPGVEIVFQRAEAPHDRGTCNPVHPHGRPAIGIETRGELRVRGRAVEIMLDIVFARPRHLYRLARGFRNLDGVGDVVRFKPPPKSSAEKRGMHKDFGRIEAGNIRRRLLCVGLVLRGRPHIASLRGHVRGAVLRLHGGMRQKRNFVDGLDFSRGVLDLCLGIAVLSRDVSGPAGALRKQFADRLARGRGVGAFVPLHIERPAALHRRPRVVGDHGDAARDLRHVLDARNGFGFACIEACHLAAEYRAARDHGIEHVFPPHIDAELRPAIHLIGSVEPPGRLANDAKVPRIF